MSFIIGYVFVILLYLFYFCKHIENAIPLNYMLFVLCGLLTAELVVRFIHSAIFNRGSESSPVIDTLVVLFNFLRNTGLRMLIMFLANGYTLLYLVYLIASNILNIRLRNILIISGLAGLSRLVHLLVSEVKYPKYFSINL
jgi:hypothetical protein